MVRGLNNKPSVIKIENKDNTLIVTRVVANLPFQVLPNYYDLDDNIQEQVYHNPLPMGLWAQIILKKLPFCGI